MDVLLFREAGECEMKIVEALATALIEGRLDVAMHHASMERLARVKPSKVVPVLLDDDWHQAIDDFHEEAVQSLLVPIQKAENPSHLMVLEPTPSQVPHYAMEYVDGSLTRHFLPDTCTVLSYDEARLDLLESTLKTHEGDILVMVRLPHTGKELLETLEAWQERNPQTSSRLIVFNIGTPLQDIQESPRVDFVNLGTARPRTLEKALAKIVSLA